MATVSIWRSKWFTICCIVSGKLLATSSAPSPSTIDLAQPAEHFNNTLTDLKLTCGEICGYDDYLDRARCDDKGLLRVPNANGCENARVLELQDNNIQQLNGNSTQGYSKVQTLYLGHNSVSVVEVGTFDNTPHLRNLLLSHNNLKEIQVGSFTETKFIESLYLEHNKLEAIREHVFSNLTKAITIYFDNNQIRFLEKCSFNGLLRLRRLCLSNNKISELDEEIFRNVSSLVTLDLHQNQLISLPRGLFEGLHFLRRVILSDNRITTIPLPIHLGITSPLELMDARNNDILQLESILPYIHVTERFLFGGNPYICDCTFITLQSLFKNNLFLEQVMYIRSSPVTCMWQYANFEVDEPLPFDCPEDGTLINDVTTATPQDLTGPSQRTESHFTGEISAESKTIAYVGNTVKTDQMEPTDPRVRPPICDWLIIYCSVLITLILASLIYFVKSLRCQSIPMTRVSGLEHSLLDSKYTGAVAEWI
ncbi:uncharacterized protein [Apostichopus japonicus]